MKQGYIVKVDDSFLAIDKAANFTLTTNKSKAHIFATQEKTINVMKHPPKILKGKQCVAEKVFVDTLAQEVLESDELIYHSVDMESIENSLNSLSTQLTGLMNNKPYLERELSKVDLEIQDLVHYLEFYSFSASEGYKIAKAIKDCRLRRRKIKDELQVINIMKTHTCNLIANGSTNAAIAGLNSRAYAPRVLTEIFQKKEKMNV